MMVRNMRAPELGAGRLFFGSDESPVFAIYLVLRLSAIFLDGNWETLDPTPVVELRLPANTIGFFLLRDEKTILSSLGIGGG
jgi:hypothetical protein